MSARHNVSRALAPHQRIAVWGAGSLAALAMNRWLPRERVVAVLDSDLAKQGKPFFGLSVADPATADLSGFDVIVVCITAYLEAFEAIERRDNRGRYFYIYELLANAGDAPQSELDKLAIDYQRTCNGNLFLTLLSCPQFMTVATYRLTRHCSAVPVLRPLFYVALFFHYLLCAFSKIELPYTVKAGAGLWFPHLGGAVFNKDVELGHCVSIFQFTTIGADDTGRMPRIGSFVTVNSGAAVLGDAMIGDHSRIGANATVLALSCPPGSTLVGTPARVIKTRTIATGRNKAVAA